MSHSKSAAVESAVLLGVDGHSVRVEAHIANGLPTFGIVGLPDAACREARDRVKAAMSSSGITFPDTRVTVNLAPSALRKHGTGLDLAITVAVLRAKGIVPGAGAGAGDNGDGDNGDGEMAFIGELGLDGAVRAIPGVLSLADAVRARTVVVPTAAATEADLVKKSRVRCVSTLVELIDALRGDAPWPDPPEPASQGQAADLPDLCDVRGQTVGRAAIEIAAAGGHHLLMTGPPGSGKTLLAKRLPGLLPKLDDQAALQTTRVHSAAGIGLPAGGLVTSAPFRAPHHGASAAALIGGGTTWVRPGEISCAHNGVLFLDELGEFAPSVLDSLRQPLEEGWVRVARAHSSVTLPARFLLIGAMNPCPCGRGGPPGACRCQEWVRRRYFRRLSGPLLDRFDLRITVEKPEVSDLMSGEPAESSASAAARVATSRAIAASRGYRCNAEIPARDLRKLVALDAEGSRLLEHKLRSGALSGRGFHRVQRVARTIADLAGREGPVESGDVSTALLMRLEPEELEAA